MTALGLNGMTLRLNDMEQSYYLHGNPKTVTELDFKAKLRDLITVYETHLLLQIVNCLEVKSGILHSHTCLS